MLVISWMKSFDDWYGSWPEAGPHGRTYSQANRSIPQGACSRRRYEANCTWTGIDDGSRNRIDVRSLPSAERYEKYRNRHGSIWDVGPNPSLWLAMGIENTTIGRWKLQAQDCGG